MIVSTSGVCTQELREKEAALRVDYEKKLEVRDTTNVCFHGF